MRLAIKSFFAQILIVLSLNSCQTTEEQIKIIPRPQKITGHSGKFEINKDTKIIVQSGTNADFFPASFLAEKIKTVSGLTLEIIDQNKLPENNFILFNYSQNQPGSKEEYKLISERKKIEINAGSAEGMFYGVQSLMQLLPAEIYNHRHSSEINLLVPAVEIIDQPRFGYRGMHLDVCRHFFPVSFIKKYIDFLAMHKLNTFHWHLTEDQGWRIEIKKYPLLTAISSVRKETVIGKTNTFDGKEYGGYYTQDEIREVVRYATERYITIIPEIEMPGHSIAALAAYPEYSCTGGPFEVSTKWGVMEDIFCAGKETTFSFLEDILTEVIDLFPSKYIHIGGDEAPKIRWEKCPDCQKRIKKENLKDEHELQNYFITRIEKFLNSKGRKIIGWDEILEGGLAPDATVMSWRGTERGIAAAKKNHNVIMVPYSHLYFDGYQADRAIEPLAIGYWAPLKKVYEFEPVPAELTKEEEKYIIGAEATLWTEYIATEDYAEYMLMPRLAALAELLWTQKELRNWKNFEERLDAQYSRYQAMGINFRIPTPEIEKVIILDKNEKVNIKNKISSAKIIYTLDGAEPDKNSNVYEQPFTVDGNTLLKACSLLKDGRTSSVVTSHILMKTNLPEGKKYGLKYKYFEGNFNKTMPGFDTLNVKSSGYVDYLSLDLPNRRQDKFAIQFDGFLNIETEGEYTLYLTADDGCRIYLNNKMVLGTETYISAPVSEKVFLKKGLNPLKIEYYEWGGAENITIKYEGPQTELQEIQACCFFTDEI